MFFVRHFETEVTAIYIINTFLERFASNYMEFDICNLKKNHFRVQNRYIFMKESFKNEKFFNIFQTMKY